MELKFVIISTVLLLFGSKNCKGATGMEVEEEEEFNCGGATYKTVSLVNFVYTHKCFPTGWDNFLDIKEVKAEIAKISVRLAEDAKAGEIEPPMPNVFKALTVSLNDIKAVIIGQDPTPQAGMATGLAFSLNPLEDPRNVPTVLNILVELKLEGHGVSLTNGDLSPWLSQGVLLLNAALTIPQRGKPGVHLEIWLPFTELLVQYISKNALRSSAWVIWAGKAGSIGSKIDTSQKVDKTHHYIYSQGYHPSPWASIQKNEFFGYNHFNCVNQFLTEAKRGPINWNLPHRSGFSSDMKPCS